MEASGGWTRSRWCIWSSCGNSHEDDAAEHDDSWQESGDAWRQEGGAWSQKGDAWSRMGAALDRKGGPWSRESESAGSQKDGHAWAGHLKPRRRRNNDAWRECGLQDIQEGSVGVTEDDDSWQKSSDGSG